MKGEEFCLGAQATPVLGRAQGCLSGQPAGRFSGATGVQ